VAATALLYAVGWGAPVMAADDPTVYDVDYLVERQQDVSDQVTATAMWIDSFFDDPRVKREKNQTRWSFTLDGSVEEGKGIETSFANELRLLLPTAEKRGQIYFSALSDDKREPLALSSETGPSVVRRPGDQNKGVTAGVGFFVQDLDERTVRLDGGAYFVALTPRFYGGVTSRMTWVAHLWEIRFTQKIHWYQETAFEAHAAVDVDRDMGKGRLLRFSTQTSWYDDRPGFFYGQVVNWFSLLGPNEAVQYDAFIWFSSTPYHKLDDQGIRFAYRRRLTGTWLYGELATWMRFPRERDFQRTVGGLARIDLYFGDTSSFASEEDDVKLY
jgi:hypothetical protein